MSGEGGRVKGRVFELTNSNREERDSANRLLLPLFAAEHFQLRAHTHRLCKQKYTTFQTREKVYCLLSLLLKSEFIRF